MLNVLRIRIPPILHSADLPPSKTCSRKHQTRNRNRHSPCRFIFGFSGKRLPLLLRTRASVIWAKMLPGRGRDIKCNFKTIGQRQQFRTLFAGKPQHVSSFRDFAVRQRKPIRSSVTSNASIVGHISAMRAAIVAISSSLRNPIKSTVTCRFRSLVSRSGSIFHASMRTAKPLRHFFLECELKKYFPCFHSLTSQCLEAIRRVFSLRVRDASE